MLSAIFVDRPRLAIVTTIAGALALYTIPIAQYPDIVPLQVSVTTTYPGANSAVVDQIVAQPIEAQVIGDCATRGCRLRSAATLHSRWKSRGCRLPEKCP
jgi:Cu/Ag efflux pump CusA